MLYYEDIYIRKFVQNENCTDSVLNYENNEF